MKKTNLLIIMIALTLVLSSCATGRDPWGNKQTRKERKALNEIGCPGHQGMIGYGNP